MSSPTAHVHRLPDGRAMGFAVFGEADGRPVVLCHGFPSSRLSGALLDAQARNLAMRLVVPDRPGHGLSDYRRLRRVATWTADLTSLADALGMARFAVLGVSTGGPYAAACGALLPQRVSAVGIASGWAPHNAPRTKPRPRLPFMPALGRQVRLLRRYSLSRLAKRLVKHGASVVEEAAAAASPADRTLLADGALRRSIAEDMREALRQGARGPARDARLLNRRWGFKLEEIRLPVWLWHGQEDRNVPLALARFMSERIPGSRAMFYRTEGHLSTFVNHAPEILQALRG